MLIYHSLTPSPPEMPEFPFADKLTHLLVYGWIMLWLGFIYRPGTRFLLFGFLLILLGVTLELVQGTTGYRSMEVSDAICSTLGVFVGWLLAHTRISSILLWTERLIYGDP
jgi:VanZ family protein